MERTIRHLFSYQQPPAIVWDYLTKPELLAQWLMPNDFEPTPGRRFRLTAKPRPRFGFDGNIYCQVLEVVPRKRLVYSWRGGPDSKRVTLDSVVTWTLTETADGTDLLLEHSGFKGMSNYLSFLVMNRGWMRIAKRLRQQLNTSSHVKP